jgi:hypothetical protein
MSIHHLDARKNQTINLNSIQTLVTVTSNNYGTDSSTLEGKILSLFSHESLIPRYSAHAISPFGHVSKWHASGGWHADFVI